VIDFEELDLLEFLDGLDINYETAGKNIGPGWVAINPCPNKHCQDDRNHFAINIGNKSINCWVCGLTGTIIKFLMIRYGIDQDQAENLIKSYMEEADLMQDQDIETLVHKTFTKTTKKVENIPPTQILKYLPGKPITKTMLDERPKLASFLRRRKIPLDLCRKFRFRYDYEKSMRIIMPIHSPKGDIVAYQGRDVTGKAMLPYITQPKDAPIGETLFNIKAWKNSNMEAVIITEGIIDAIVLMDKIRKHHWGERIQKNSAVMACFRNKPTVNQANLIYDAYVLLSVLDHDSWWNSREFDECCPNTDIHAIPLPVGKDPASLTDDEFLDLNLSEYLS
jgi:hypothetical protein